MREAIEQEIQFLREQIKALRRTANAIERQIDHFETRIDDLRRVVQPPPGSPSKQGEAIMKLTSKGDAE